MSIEKKLAQLFRQYCIYILAFILVGCTYSVRKKDQPMVNKLLILSRQVVENAEFQRIIELFSASDFDHTSDSISLKKDDGAAVLTRLKSHNVKDIRCRRTHPLNRVTNAWEGGAVPQLRCRFFEKRSTASWVGTLVHEHAHAAGYRHKGNARSGNECTVPHILGDLATFVLESQQADLSLPADVCPSLRKAIEQG